MQRHEKNVKIIGPMPPFYEVVYALWGEGCDCDSDGDSYERNSRSWRELTIRLRPELTERVDIDPLKEDQDTIKITASDPTLLQRTIDFLIQSGAIYQQ